ncbi:hypothetical protein GCM10025868_45680 [Angustibacter aerolatus]|uniref:EAL domain-containing protein n=1 Tax=Angustibacter aerolatus TaxID=1162965 RepID=A0ABQ6JMR2_9ACTN|nr:hypothetical protein GCM10025868_45680 [Angustibacter aerolatus]
MLEVLEGVDVDDRLVERLQVLRGQGYDLALDDFEPGSGADRLIPLAGFVKLDVTALPLDEPALAGGAGCTSAACWRSPSGSRRARCSTGASRPASTCSRASGSPTRPSSR